MLHLVTFSLLVIGGLNWLLFGLFGWEVTALWGDSMDGLLARVIYLLVGASAVYEVLTHKKNCKKCDSVMAGGNKPMM